MNTLKKKFRNTLKQKKQKKFICSTFKEKKKAQKNFWIEIWKKKIVTKKAHKKAQHQS